MLNLSPRKRLSALVIAIATAASLAACGGGSDDVSLGDTSTTTDTTVTATVDPYVEPPTCEEQGMVNDPEVSFRYYRYEQGSSSGAVYGPSCTTQADIDARNAWRREFNDGLQLVNDELAQKVGVTSDPLVTLMNDFCRSPFRGEGPKRYVGQNATSLPLAYADHARRLWEAHWFSDNLWKATYDFSSAVSTICGPSAPVVTPQSLDTDSRFRANHPRWELKGYASMAECMGELQSFQLCW